MSINTGMSNPGLGSTTSSSGAGEAAGSIYVGTGTGERTRANLEGMDYSQEVLVEDYVIETEPVADALEDLLRINSMIDEDTVNFISHCISYDFGLTNSQVATNFMNSGSALIGLYSLTYERVVRISERLTEMGVSPAFFFSYSIAEGAGQQSGSDSWAAGGFINHFTRADNPYGPYRYMEAAVQDATRLLEMANTTTESPAWVDVQFPAAVVPPDVREAAQRHFDEMPTGTIGRTKIPLTAAATWAVYHPPALNGSVNGVQNYANPFLAQMQTIASWTEGANNNESTQIDTNIEEESVELYQQSSSEEPVSDYTPEIEAPTLPDTNLTINERIESVSEEVTTEDAFEHLVNHIGTDMYSTAAGNFVGGVTRSAFEGQQLRFEDMGNGTFRISANGVYLGFTTEAAMLAYLAAMETNATVADVTIGAEASQTSQTDSVHLLEVANELREVEGGTEGRAEHLASLMNSDQLTTNDVQYLLENHRSQVSPYTLWALLYYQGNQIPTEQFSSILDLFHQNIPPETSIDFYGQRPLSGSGLEHYLDNHLSSFYSSNVGDINSYITSLSESGNNILPQIQYHLRDRYDYINEQVESHIANFSNFEGNIREYLDAQTGLSEFIQTRIIERQAEIEYAFQREVDYHVENFRNSDYFNGNNVEGYIEHLTETGVVLTEDLQRAIIEQTSINPLTLPYIIDDGRLAMPVWYQGNFANYNFGPFSMPAGGCGPTSIAMAVTYVTGEFHPPQEVAEYLASRGQAVSAGLSWGAFPISAEQYGVYVSDNIRSIDSIIAALEAGNPVVASYNSGPFTHGGSGHLIVLSGIDSDGRIFVNDPACVTFTEHSTFTVDQILNGNVGFWVYSSEPWQH